MQVLDNTTFNNLIERFRQPLTRAAYHLCGNKEASLDIVQETLLDAYKGYHTLREQDKAGAWLYSILRRKAISFYKAQNAEERTINELAFLNNHNNNSSEVFDIYVEEINKLPEEDREILAGKYLLDLSYSEIAEALGIKEGAVRVRSFRAKMKLREFFSNNGSNISQKGRLV